MERSLIDSLVGGILSSYDDLIEAESLTHVATYRQNMVEIVTFLRLSSVYNCDMAIDAFVVDCLENEYRFTVFYSVQSSINNVGFRLETKSTENLFLVSLQDIYPAFNWAEREI